jgi:hypothetical protein
MDLADETIREREALSKAFQPVFEGRDVVRDLDDVIERDPRRFVQLEEEKVGERRLRPFDLRGEHGLFADVGVKEEFLVGQKRGDTVEPAERQHCRLQLLLQDSVEIKRRGGRQRGRNEGTDFLSAGRSDFVATCSSTPHGAPLTEKEL